MITAANWNGALALIVLGAIILTVVISPLLLALFRRSVRRAMRERTRAPTAPGTEALPRSKRSDAPRLEIVDDAAALSGGAPLRARLTRRRSRAAAIYALGGIIYALITTYAIVSDTTDWGVHRFLAVFFLMAIWPAIPIVAGVLVPQANRRLLLLAGVAALEIVVGQLLVDRLWVAWLGYAGVPTALFLVIQNRKLRTIVPLVITFALLAGIGQQLSVEILGRILGTLTAEQSTTFALMFFLGWLLLAAWIVARITGAYERKRYSEQSFAHAIYWVIFAADGAITNRNAWWWWPVAAAAYAAIVSILLARLRRQAERARPTQLLVLRVFGSPARGQRLFDGLGSYWRYIGPIHLIAGTDSAVANLDPAEAFRYLTFRFRSLYVSGLHDLDRRIAVLDTKPDPDGRYRVNDFYCYDDTWKTTFSRLLRVADTVLVDLSGFTRRNLGVTFELRALLNQRPLDSFVLIIDENTEHDFLGAMLTAEWQQLDPASPNAALISPVIRLLRRPAASATVDALIAALPPDAIIAACSNTSTWSATSSATGPEKPTAPAPVR